MEGRHLNRPRPRFSIQGARDVKVMDLFVVLSYGVTALVRREHGDYRHFYEHVGI